MKIWSRIKSAVNRGVEAIQNWYRQSFHESATTSPLRGQHGYRWWSGRAPDPNEPGEACSRQESIRRSIDLLTNDALARRLRALYIQYVVGGGLRVKAASEDPDWNARRQVKWDRWCEMPDLTSTQDFNSFIVMACSCAFDQGAGYVLKTRGDTPPYRPRIQFIEAMNVCTPPDLADRKDIYDGKQTDARGRVIFYYVRQVVHGVESFRKIDAKDIEPICDADRPGELHTWPYLDPVLNKLQDLRELRLLAMDKAKEAAETKNVWNTHNSELPDSGALRRDEVSTTKALKDGTEIIKQKLQMMDDRLGGKNFAVGIDEKVSQLASMTPNEIEQAHYRILASEICAGVNIPTMLVFPESVQGTVARAVLDDFASYCRNQFLIYERVVKAVYRYVTEEEIKIDRDISDIPKGFNWWKCAVKPPRAPNVDVGHNMSALIAAHEAGGATLDEFFVPLGQDTEEQIDRGFQILAHIMERANHYKVPVEFFKRSIAEALKLQMAEAAKKSAESDAAIKKERQQQAA